MKNRMLALIKGEKFDRIPFVQYDNMGICAAEAQEIWPVVGRENLGLLRWSYLHRLEHPNCKYEIKDIVRDGIKGQIIHLHTPKGILEAEKFFEPAFESESYQKHFIQSREDYEKFLAYLQDIVVVEDRSRYLNDYKILGDDGFPMVTVERTPFQQMWILWVSLLDLCIHMVDYEDILEECFRLLGDIQLRVYDIVMKLRKELPIHYINVPDNITAPVIGVNNFRKYCIPYYNKLAEMLEGTDIQVVVHMDGDLKPLWSDIKELKINAIDSLTPPPDNDTTAAEATRMWPDKKFFLNFPSSVHLEQPQKIYETAMDILNQAGNTGRLWIQVSENVPPGIWKKSYPHIIKAIREFGTPEFTG